jgi:hypothetical protein
VKDQTRDTVATHEPDPAADPRWLGDEVVRDTQERELEIAKVATELSERERLHTLFATPEWPTLAEILYKNIESARALLETASLEDVRAYQARISAFKWLLEFPERVASDVKTLSMKLEKLTESEREE